MAACFWEQVRSRSNSSSQMTGEVAAAAASTDEQQHGFNSCNSSGSSRMWRSSLNGSRTSSSSGRGNSGSIRRRGSSRGKAAGVSRSPNRISSMSNSNGNRI